ncbi:MAG: class I SAM-dependent methyltransferase [Candidatus Saccharimonadales bacterium]
MSEAINPGEILSNYSDSLEVTTGRQPKRLYNVADGVLARFEVYKYAIQDADLRAQVLDYADEMIKSADKSLETGCSEGIELIKLRTERGLRGELIGLDIHSPIFYKSELKVKNEKLRGINFMAGKAEELPFADGSLNVVMAWYMMYETEPRQALSEIWRVLKPGGLLLLTTHGEYNIQVHRRVERMISILARGRIQPPELRARRFSASIGKLLLAQQGFEEVKEFHTYCPIVIPAEDAEVYRRSINTRKNEFNPVPTGRQWNRIMEQIVDPYLQSEIDAQGYILDNVDRWGWVYQKPLKAEGWSDQ